MTISPDIANLSAAEAFRFYRDSLGWHVYPVHPPGAKCQFPGKQPAVKAWWNYDPQDCDLDSRFHNGYPFNIGVAPRGGLVFIDLDSKPDQGASVQKFLAEHPELEKVPRHITRGGVHLVMICPDLPGWKDAKGKRYHGEVVGQINEGVSAELYHCERQNVVLPPSKHASGFFYAWDVFGDVIEWPWDRLRKLFCLVEPAPKEQKKKKKDAPWHLQFRGDLASLDLISLFKELGSNAELQDADDERYIIPCPWTSEHSDQGEADARIWQGKSRRPAFKCHHAHCNGRAIKDVIQWAEAKAPGIVDRLCTRLRVWEEGQLSVTGKVRVLHAIGRLESEVYAEVGKVIAPHHAWFVRAGEVNVIEQVPSGFTYSDEATAEYAVDAYTTGFKALNGIQAKGGLEKYAEPGILVIPSEGEDDEEREFVPKSFSTDFCSGMIQADQLKEKLPLIARLLTVPLPFRVGKKLVYPKPGYDRRFGTYLMPGAPEITPMKIEKALKILDKIHSGFCFTNEQSRTHSLARLITPFGRAMLGWTTRVPLWFYTANRPRAGKDYLSAITLLVYEGTAFEDLPIGKESEETGKRLVSAARNGRRFMHFSNCQVYLQDQYLIQAITNPVISGRRLGSNDATSDLSIPNEIEFSISANVGLTYREDLGPRMRKIELAFFEEDANSRTFPDKFLHQSIKNNRALVLSAIASLYDNWALKGFPKGKTIFTTFPEWAELCGGVMLAAERGDPCLPFAGDFEEGGDLKTEAMRTLFEVCHTRFGDTWIIKKQVYQCVQEAAEESEALRWFGDLDGTEDARKNQTRLGMLLSQFKGRILGGVQMVVDESVAKVAARKFKFTKERSESATSATSATCSGSSQAREKNNKHTNDVCECECSDVTANDALQVAKVAEVAEKGGISTNFLALDLETYAEVKVSGKKNPKIKPSGGALHPCSGEIRLLTLADDAGNLRQYDLKTAPTLPPEILSALNRTPLIIHNASFDLLFLAAKLGLKPDHVFCTLTAARLLSGSKTVKHDLGTLLDRYLGVNVSKEYGASDWGSMILLPEQLEYARDDVQYLHQLKDVLQAELAEANLTRVFEMEMALLPVVVAMEQHGFPVDAEKLKAFGNSMRAEADTMAADLRVQLGVPLLNVNSTQQVVTAFKGVGIEIDASNKEILTALNHPLAILLLQYREKDNLAGKVVSLLKHVRDDGRIHARFNSLGTETGRFSSSKPNLQQIPGIRHTLEFRACFIPSGSDRKLIVADANQVELRRAAALSKDQKMIAAFRANEDMHRKTAAAVLEKMAEEVNKYDRTLAKSVNFGFIYGQGSPGYRRYAKTEYGLDVSEEQAVKLRTAFFKEYAGLALWHSEAWRKAQAGESEARTVMGRRLVARKDDEWSRFNVHTNFVVQGDCAEYQKMCMINLARVLPPDAHLIATVHDEVIIDASAGEAEHLCTVIQTVMEETWLQLFGEEVPIKVDAKICGSWGEK